MADASPPRKQRKLEDVNDSDPNPNDIRQRRSAFLASLSRSVTPPSRDSSAARPRPTIVPEAPPPTITSQPNSLNVQREDAKYIRSPFQLTHIRDLPANHNVDAVTLSDILGDPMIKECWQFNYLLDVDWLMTHFDPDVRDIVQVKVVHGSWKREAPNRIGIEDACQRHPNVKAITAYLPDPFGTHHSKMMVLFRHDDLVQVIIHTANMIPQDWTNMTQAVWRSPLLPLLGTSDQANISEDIAPVGSGQRFKHDLLTYFNAYRDQYGNFKLANLVKQLKMYDFSAIRAALVASAPSKLSLKAMGPDEPLFGWPALRRALRQVPIHEDGPAQGIDPNASTITSRPTPRIVLQVSSIATLGKYDSYLRSTIFSALSSTSTPKPSPSSPMTQLIKPQTPNFSIIFPTADTIRKSLDGYTSGHSIHMKIQSAAQQLQLQYMRKYLCHWSTPSPSTPNPSQKKLALRGRAAPHIKTYIRFHSSTTMDEIDWALLTSANLSQQAWGTTSGPTGDNEVRVQSYECGVLVWPDLFLPEALKGSKGDEGRGKMVPVFGTDHPTPDTLSDVGKGEEGQTKVVVGLRMPYDIPLTPYGRDDVPWCATMNHWEGDWKGDVYGGFEER